MGDRPTFGRLIADGIVEEGPVATAGGTSSRVGLPVNNIDGILAMRTADTHLYLGGLFPLLIGEIFEGQATAKSCIILLSRRFGGNRPFATIHGLAGV